MVFEIQFAILKLFLSLFASSLPSEMSAAIDLNFFLIGRLLNVAYNIIKYLKVNMTPSVCFYSQCARDTPTSC